MAFRIDRKRMHGVIAGQRQIGDHDCRRLCRHSRVRRQGIAEDFVVLLGVDGALVEGYARTTGSALPLAVTETLDHVGTPVPLAILERHEEAAVGWSVVSVIAAAPRIDVEDAIGRNDHVADVSEIVGEDRRAKPGWERYAAVIGRAAWLRLRKSHRSDRKQRSGGENG